ncbi:MAG TPA: 50S ribosomal protein L15 [Candidatus Binataceae bacterium]|nr:50S ribosomal protein L15 [Candidatus Binataceae bacterium]
MNLSDLKPAPRSKHRIKRIGRGIGSGHGKTSGRGHKGLGSRSHGNTPPGYEGGQMPLQRRTPKQGFRRTQKSQARREKFDLVNVAALAEFADGTAIDAALLIARGIVRKGHKIKILGAGELKSRLTVRADAFSGSAREKITAAGGSAELIAPTSA